MGFFWQLLKKIPGAVAVVAVVGKFHSGKSFLMNQLMGKSAGFGIGPTVRPQTMGIWMWGKPLSLKQPSGQQLSIVFIDTEGFAANNISETYDAKIFAVSTLLSSYLIYNSVKIIDQSDIDYLEVLSRRTQVSLKILILFNYYLFIYLIFNFLLCLVVCITFAII